MSCVCGKKADNLCSRCKIKKYCSVDCQRSDWNDHKKSCFDIEKITKFMYESEPLVIEGNLRHHDNLLRAKELYGLEFEGKIIDTKYFEHLDLMQPTLVCKDDESIVLGKLRRPGNFTYCKVNLESVYGNNFRTVITPYYL